MQSGFLPSGDRDAEGLNANYTIHHTGKYCPFISEQASERPLQHNRLTGDRSCSKLTEVRVIISSLHKNDFTNGISCIVRIGVTQSAQCKKMSALIYECLASFFDRSTGKEGIIAVCKEIYWQFYQKHCFQQP